MKELIERTVLVVLVLLVAMPVMAQGAPPATPIDGGLSILLAAGGAYGIKKLRDSRRS
ncbi:PID-CTERM protein-sorting domain-containing protein [Marinoscillum pacificum]|uniref:PID-CTERM protein-sorting domain-containing protein n=1 Tax=Marinoscillum pacificum TaxID=392723 RepID=UPI0021578D28|nr:hypothetical protein [Marinoscillum pacificum]